MGFAHHQATSGAGQGHTRGIGQRLVLGINRRAIAAGQVGGVQDVFDRHRHPVQHTFGRGLGVQRTRLGDHRVWRQVGPGMQLRLSRRGAGHTGLSQSLGAELAPGDAPRGFGRAQVGGGVVAALGAAHGAPGTVPAGKDSMWVQISPGRVSQI